MKSEVFLDQLSNYNTFNKYTAQSIYLVNINDAYILINLIIKQNIIYSFCLINPFFDVITEPMNFIYKIVKSL